MKTSRLVGLMGLMLVVLAVSASVSYGFHGNRGVPSAMYYADTESWTPYSQDGFNPYAGYEPGTQMIHPFNAPTPWSYRAWNRKLVSPAPPLSYEYNGQTYGYNPFATYGTSSYGTSFGKRGVLRRGVAVGVPCEECEKEVTPAAPVAPEETEAVPAEEQPAAEPALSYATSDTGMAYGQEYVPEFAEGDTFYGDSFDCGGCGACDMCCDPCFDMCCDPCFDTVVAPKRSWGLFSGCKLFGNTKSWFSKLSCKKSFCSSSFNDAWFVDDCCFPCCDPCAVCCDPCAVCCDPCCGAGFGEMGTGSCCGQTEGESTLIEDGSLSAPVPPTPEETNPAPTPTGIEATTPADSGQISVPAYPSAPAPAANPASGVINMLVPEDAVVYINGYKTKLTGTERSFTANHLEEGQSYEFEVCVVSSVNGEVVQQVKSTVLTAGSFSTLAFNEASNQLGTVALK
ncbi:MAG: TIGR03000 domain-containing protein [Planctomycetia bacterium]|nr:TIGR03000 domain-containing protein [Planctomycetia bacterium]